MKRSSIVVAIATLGLLAGVVPSFAQSEDFMPDDERWHFSVAPGFWAAGMKGSVALQGAPEVALDMPFNEIFDNLEFGIQGHAEARKGEWGFGADVLYMNLEVPVAEGHPVFGLFDLSVDMTETIVEGFAFKLLSQGKGRPNNPAYLDVVFGLRYFNTSNQLSGEDTEGTRKTLEFVDALVGFRGVMPIADRFSVLGRVDAATLGSDLTWNLNGDVRWHIAQHWRAGLGFRMMDIDYEKDGLAYKPRMKGPYAGVGYTW